MSHTCEECGETFDTLSGLRLHDCPEDETAAERERHRQDQAIDTRIRKQTRAENMAARQTASEALLDALEQANTGDHTAVYHALGQYERHLAEEWNNYEEGHYWGFHRVFFGEAVDGVDAAVQAEGWPYLLDILEAYWPEITLDIESYSDHEEYRGNETDDFEDFPHVSHVLTTVTGKQLVRTCLSDGVEAIPADALEYLLLFHRHPGGESPWIDSMSYGWGIGHPEHPVADTIETLVDGEYEIWASTAIEHALHADQHAATTLLERLFEAGIVSDPALLLRPLGSIDRCQYPDSSEHWNWETLYPTFAEAGFDWDPDVRERLRKIVDECGLAQQLPDEWTFTDIVL
ncbi:MAG: hypothetical protein ABEH65_10050 [Halobacteriales archaeon]